MWQDDEAYEPEHWLLRFWPDEHARDGLSGPPRRLSGNAPLGSSTTDPLQAAVRAWDQQGWPSSLFGLPGLSNTWSTFLRTGAATAEQLGLAGEDPLLPPPGEYDHYADTRTTLADLSSAYKLPLTTRAELLQALLAWEVLARVGTDRYVPNPALPPAWKLAGLSEAAASSRRHQALRNRYASLVYDLRHLLGWAPNGVLKATPHQVALRLAVPVTGVIAALELLTVDRPIFSVEPAPQELGPDTLVTVCRRDRAHLGWPRRMASALLCGTAQGFSGKTGA